MLRILLALAVLGLVIVTAMKMMSSQLGGVSAVTGGGLPGAAPAATPKAAVDQAAQSVQKAVQAGAAISAERASEAGR